MFQTRILVASLCMFVFITASCRQSDQNNDQASRSGGTAHIGILGNIENLFPFNIKEYYAQEIINFMISPALHTLNNNSEPEMQIAQGWHHDKEEHSLTFFINRNLRWSSGRPVNAEDIISTFNFIRINAELMSETYDLSIIAKAHYIDSATVKFMFSEKVDNPLRFTQFPILPKEYFTETNDFKKIEDKYLNNFNGCGPFLFTSRRRDKLIFTRNPQYPGQLPYLDRVVFHFYDSFTSLLKDLKRETLNFIPSIPVTEAHRIGNLPSYKRIMKDEHGFTFIGWNLRRPLLQSVNIRKALTLAIDRNTIVDGILSGYARVLDIPAYPEFWARFCVQALEYDPQTAGDLLAREGWINKDNNRILIKNKRRLSLNLLTNQESEIRRELAVNLKEYYRTIGINVIIETMPWLQLLKRMAQGNFDGIIINWAENSPMDIADLFSSTGIAGGNNFMHYKNPDVDEALKTALENPDREIRRQSWIRFQKIVFDEQPVTILFNQKIVSLVLRNLTNVHPEEYRSFKFAKEWRLSARK